MNRFMLWMKKHQKEISILILVFAFFAVFLAIYATPYESDDLVYMNKWLSDEPLESVKDVFDYEYQQYFQWSGRAVAHTILQILLLIGKPYSSLLTTIAYFSVAYFIQKSVNGKVTLTGFVFALGLLSFVNQSTSQTLLWATGSANYTWTMLIMLFALQPALKFFRNEELTKKDAVALLFALPAGWCNENISTALALLILVIQFVRYRSDKRISKLLIAETVLWLAGCALLILAPGNVVRSHGMPTGLMAVLYRGHGQLSAWTDWTLPAWIAYVISVFAVHSEKKKVSMISKFFAVTAAISVLVMVASPTFPERSAFGAVVFLVIGVCMNIQQCCEDTQFKAYLIGIMMLIGMFGRMLIEGVLTLARSLGVDIPGGEY